MSFARRWKRRHPPCVMCGEPVRAARPGVLPMCDDCRPTIIVHVLGAGDTVEVLAEGHCDCPDCLGAVVCEPGEGSCPA